MKGLQSKIMDICLDNEDVESDVLIKSLKDVISIPEITNFNHKATDLTKAFGMSENEYIAYVDRMNEIMEEGNVMNVSESLERIYNEIPKSVILLNAHVSTKAYMKLQKRLIRAGIAKRRNR